jgi:hypothetical protein
MQTVIPSHCPPDAAPTVPACLRIVYARRPAAGFHPAGVWCARHEATLEYWGHDTSLPKLRRAAEKANLPYVVLSRKRSGMFAIVGMHLRRIPKAAKRRV